METSNTEVTTIIPKEDREKPVKTTGIMSTQLSRRSFLGVSGALAATTLMPNVVLGQSNDESNETQHKTDDIDVRNPETWTPSFDDLEKQTKKLINTFMIFPHDRFSRAFFTKNDPELFKGWGTDKDELRYDSNRVAYSTNTITIEDTKAEPYAKELQHIQQKLADIVPHLVAVNNDITFRYKGPIQAYSASEFSAQTRKGMLVSHLHESRHVFDVNCDSIKALLDPDLVANYYADNYRYVYRVLDEWTELSPSELGNAKGYGADEPLFQEEFLITDDEMAKKDFIHKLFLQELELQTYLNEDGYYEPGAFTNIKSEDRSLNIVTHFIAKELKTNQHGLAQTFRESNDFTFDLMTRVGQELCHYFVGPVQNLEYGGIPYIFTDREYVVSSDLLSAWNERIEISRFLISNPNLGLAGAARVNLQKYASDLWQLDNSNPLPPIIDTEV